MMVALKVMAYFKISLSTRNWDSAIKKAAVDSTCQCNRTLNRYLALPISKLHQIYYH